MDDVWGWINVNVSGGGGGDTAIKVSIRGWGSRVGGNNKRAMKTRNKNNHPEIVNHRTLRVCLIICTISIMYDVMVPDDILHIFFPAMNKSKNRKLERRMKRKQQAIDNMMSSGRLETGKINQPINQSINQSNQGNFIISWQVGMCGPNRPTHPHLPTIL